MKTNILSITGLSLLLLLGSGPAVLLAHEGHDHGDRRSRYSEREDAGRYAPQREDGGREEEDEYDEEDETERPSARRYPPPARGQSAPRDRRDQPW